MAIVFVVWVGAGPFAGSLALALHTAAALAKLYSEQVESISPGPIEAVRATGANRLQTIIYSVVPQIVPPYISFTMYRWDINVRMSTILGFVGGGGIGSILQQNINLLNYRAAAVQMLAIAIVVATMDWASSRPASVRLRMSELRLRNGKNERLEHELLSPRPPRPTRARAGKRTRSSTSTALPSKGPRPIIHSKAFRRLKHKTQVFLNPEGDHVTRLTHTCR